MPRLLAVALIAVLSGAALPLIPVGGPLSVALADDDDDDRSFHFSGDDDDDWDDDDDDDDDDRRRRFVAPAAPPAAIIVAAPAEIVVGPLTADDLARIAANGFVIIADAPVAAFGGGVIAASRCPPVSPSRPRASASRGSCRPHWSNRTISTGRWRCRACPATARPSR